MNLTEDMKREMDRTFREPTFSLSAASFYASMTGQGEAFHKIEESIDRVVMLADELAAEGKLDLVQFEGEGLAGEQLQQVADIRAAEDPRFAEINELAKARFLIQVASPETNKLMLDRAATGGSVGLDGSAEVRALVDQATRPSALN